MSDLNIQEFIFNLKSYEKKFFQDENFLIQKIFELQQINEENILEVNLELEKSNSYHARIFNIVLLRRSGKISKVKDTIEGLINDLLSLKRINRLQELKKIFNAINLKSESLEKALIATEAIYGGDLRKIYTDKIPIKDVVNNANIYVKSVEDFKYIVRQLDVFTLKELLEIMFKALDNMKSDVIVEDLAYFQNEHNNLKLYNIISESYPNLKQVFRKVKEVSEPTFDFSHKLNNELSHEYLKIERECKERIIDLKRDLYEDDLSSIGFKSIILELINLYERLGESGAANNLKEFYEHHVKDKIHDV